MSEVYPTICFHDWGGSDDGAGCVERCHHKLELILNGLFIIFTEAELKHLYILKKKNQDWNGRLWNARW